MIAGKAFLPHEWGSYAWRSPGECQPTELWCLHCKNYIPVSKMWEKCVSRELDERDAKLDRLERTYIKTACSACGEVLTGLTHDCLKQQVPKAVRGAIDDAVRQRLYNIEAWVQAEAYRIADERIGKARLELVNFPTAELRPACRIVPGDKA